MAYKIRDVADRAGVSKSTVSRVLNGSSLVDSETRKRVLEAAKKLNYYRSASAHQLARGGRSDFFGLVISDIENPVFPETVKGFETAATANGYDLLLCTTNYHVERAEAAVRKMIENGVRGVAIMTSSLSEEVVAPLTVRGIPVVILDLESPRRSLSSIAVDYSTGVSEAVEHLAQLGHTQVAFIAGPDDRRSARRYREAVVKAVHKHKLQLQHIIGCDQTLEGGRAAVWELSKRAHMPTALICVNDLTAIGATTALRDLGISIPGQVSVLGCEDIYLARLVNPPLTTVRFDRKVLGGMAFEELERMSRTKQPKGTKVRLQTRLIVRSSTAANAQKAVKWKTT